MPTPSPQSAKAPDSAAFFLPAAPPYSWSEILRPLAAESLLVKPWPVFAEALLAETVRRAGVWLEHRARREHAFNAGRAETARRMADALRSGCAVERYGAACARLFVPACPTDAWSYVFEPEFKRGARSRLPLEEALTLAATERLRRFALWRAATAPEQ